MAVTTRYSRPSTPALCEGGRAEDSKSQHPMHVSAITNDLFFPFRSHSPIKTHTHAPSSGLVQYIFSSPARLAYVFCLRLLSPRRQAKNALHYAARGISTASSSSVMIGGASCTLMSRNIRRAVGSPSSCGRRFPLKPLSNT
jgi:hypothetical protein